MHTHQPSFAELLDTHGASNIEADAAASGSAQAYAKLHAEAYFGSNTAGLNNRGNATDSSVGPNALDNVTDGNFVSLQIPTREIEAVVHQMEKQVAQAATTIDAAYIRNNFTGDQQRQLLTLMEQYRIGSIVLGPRAANGTHSMTINFTEDMSVGPLTIPRALNGTLQFTSGGFNLTNLQGVMFNNTSIVELQYNPNFNIAALWAITPPGSADIPLAGQSALGSTIYTAINGFRPPQ